MREHVNDVWVQKARAEGYRSRAAYKLLQIQEKDRILAPGMTVVDLGATPGGWSQVAGRIVGSSGLVLAVDRLPMVPLRNVEFLLGDFETDETLAAIESALAGRTVHLVLSDMAPNMSGIGAVDQVRSVGLAELALDFAGRFLSPGGTFLVKVFQGAGFEALVKQLRAGFEQVSVRKPDASRGRSSENYLLARKRRAAWPGEAERMGLESDQSG